MAFRSQGGLLAPTCGSEETEVGAFVCHDIRTSNQIRQIRTPCATLVVQNKLFACFRRQSVDPAAFNQPLKPKAAAATAFLELNVEHLELADQLAENDGALSWHITASFLCAKQPRGSA